MGIASPWCLLLSFLFKGRKTERRRSVFQGCYNGQIAVFACGPMPAARKPKFTLRLRCGVSVAIVTTELHDSRPTLRRRLDGTDGNVLSLGSGVSTLRRSKTPSFVLASVPRPPVVHYPRLCASRRIYSTDQEASAEYIRLNGLDSLYQTKDCLTAQPNPLKYNKVGRPTEDVPSAKFVITGRSPFQGQNRDLP